MNKNNYTLTFSGLGVGGGGKELEGSFTASMSDSVGQKIHDQHVQGI